MKIQLKAIDGQVCEIDREAVRLSTTLNNMFTDSDRTQVDVTNDPISVKVNSGLVLKKVIEWCEHHVGDSSIMKSEEDSERRIDDIPAWDMEYLKIGQGELFELMVAANYLDIRGLLDITCKQVANMIKGKSPEDLRRTFNIPDDLTAEEKELMSKENAWIDD